MSQLRVDPLPDDGAEWKCAAGVEYDSRLRVVRVECDAPAIGALPAEVAKTFGVMRAVCQAHREFIADEILDDGPLSKYLNER